MHYDLRKIVKFPRFPSFLFCPILKIENLEVSESFLLLQILTLIVTKDTWKNKNELKQKLPRLYNGLRRKKRKLPRFPSFQFCPVPKIKTGKSRKDSFTSKFDSSCNLRCKNDQKLTKRGWSSCFFCDL